MPVADVLMNAGILKNGLVHAGPARCLLPIIEAASDFSPESQFWANISIFWSISTSKDARPTPKKIFDELLRELECHLDFILCFCTDACSGTAPETCSYIS